MLTDLLFAWAKLADGKLISASQVSYVPRAQRIDYYCPVCGELLIARTGQVNRPHFAHHSGSGCVVARAVEASHETASHFNAKNEIAQLLGGCQSLWVMRQCTGRHQTKYALIARDWDSIKVEYQDDSLRPDVCLLKDNRPTAFIEIRVQHAVSREKYRHYKDRDVPFIEITPLQLRTYAPHDDGIAVSFELARPEIRDWNCDECLRMIAAHKAREQEKRDQMYADRGVLLRQIVDDLERQGLHGAPGNPVSKILKRFGLDYEGLADREASK